MIAVGNRHQYNDIEMVFNIKGTGSVAFAVHDQRDWLLTKKKEINFVGYMRSGVGIPYNIGTKSGSALSDDMTQSIGAALTKCGFNMVPITTYYTESPEIVYQKCRDADSDKILILTLNDWFVDSYNISWLTYNIKLSVFDASGKHITNKELVGKDTLGGSFWNPVKFTRKAIPVAYRKKMEELFNSAEISGKL